MSTFDFANSKRVVVKIGSSLLVDPVQGLRSDWLDSVAQDVRQSVDAGGDVTIVSSGAIALGRQILGIQKPTLRLDESQAAAAVGQIELSRLFRETLNRHGLNCGQILVTIEDTEMRRRYLNARATMQGLLALGVVPIVNENDTVATTEIRYGDNDRLSARVAIMISADLLVILSDVDGLFSRPPAEPGAKLIERVDRVTPHIEAMAGGPASSVSRGGMKTKIKAASMATSAGTHMIIAGGTTNHPLRQIRDGGRCTLFTASETPMSARKKWIAGDLTQAGSVTIDDGAARAILANRSLLPIGVVEVSGEFSRGEVVDVFDRAGNLIARGLSNYDALEARAICGLQADRIAERIGYHGPENLIHRDDLVVFSVGNVTP